MMLQMSEPFTRLHIPIITVEIYEDILEDMTRSEVEAIQSIVKEHADRVFPGCQTRVMGSYRRGKKQLGDVDILIVHPKYKNYVPGNVMIQLVESLARSDHLEFHLTELPGLYHEVIADDEGHVTANLEGSTPPLDYMPAAQSKVMLLRKSKIEERRKIPEWFGSSTYLSVFRSPTVSGRRRRVDFKLYPYNALAFATLYFTGGKYFNRSMRQWAKSEHNWQLDDKGIKDRRTNKYIDFDPPLKTEQDVCRVLGIVYKRPADRKFFDDVEPLHTH
jgi:DNA polymerase IV